MAISQERRKHRRNAVSARLNVFLQGGGEPDFQKHYPSRTLETAEFFDRCTREIIAVDNNGLDGKVSFLNEKPDVFFDLVDADFPCSKFMTILFINYIIMNIHRAIKFVSL